MTTPTIPPAMLGAAINAVFNITFERSIGADLEDISEIAEAAIKAGGVLAIQKEAA